MPNRKAKKQPVHPLLQLVLPLCLAVCVGLLPAGALADDIDCSECHDDVVVDAPAHPDVTCIDCHTNVTAAHDGADLEPLSDEESCESCHWRDGRAVQRSVHGAQVGCNQCHGDPHRLHAVDDLASAVSATGQLSTCGDCHDGEPTPLDAYRHSVHARALLQSGLVSAPGCSDCHGAHDVLASGKRDSMTSFRHLPETCGACHALLLDDWTALSAHGRGWEVANLDVPTCADCHASHGVSDPHTDEARLAAAGYCGNCHEDRLTTFRTGFHGKANALGQVSAANCADCHTAHHNLPADDPRSSVHPDNLVATCANCHTGASAAFATFDPHIDPSDPNDSFAVYVIWVLMTALLVGVFGFFGVHDALWLQRGLVGLVRGEYWDDPDENRQYVRRFSRMNVRLHLVVVLTFLTLALTGLPLSFSDKAWAQTLMAWLGGPEIAGIIHRVAAVGTFGYFAWHLGDLLYRRLFRRERGMFWGPTSMVPQPKDFRDLGTNLRHFLYLGGPAPADRWHYIEKFDYLAVFWGVAVIGLSGLMLWFPTLFTGFLPGWTINAAYVVHSEEALLATGFIFIFHFFHTHLRPEVFPMDTAIFTGKVPLTRFRRERPLEYARLVASGKLDTRLVDPPTAREKRRAYLLGTLFVATGVALAIGIISALLGR
jgi:cytochrome b subunit of formate dehydrogenase